jgi:hypothetical protein
MITKADAKLLNELVDRELRVCLRNEDLTLQCSGVRLFATRPGHTYSATVSNGNASMTFLITRLRGHSRMEDGSLMLMV